MFVCYSIWALSFDQIRIKISHNSVAKQKLLRKKVFSREFNFAWICDYHKNIKQRDNGIKKSKRNQTCHVYHVNAWNAAYLKLYLASASYFKCVKHAESLCLKKSKNQELSYN